MSFFPHPKTVISNGKKQVHYLMPLAEKEKMFATAWSAISFISVQFDKEFAALSPEAVCRSIFE